MHQPGILAGGYPHPIASHRTLGRLAHNPTALDANPTTFDVPSSNFRAIVIQESSGALQGWLKADAVKQLSSYGESFATISVPIKHDAAERKYLMPDGLQRDAVH